MVSTAQLRIDGLSADRHDALVRSLRKRATQTPRGPDEYDVVLLGGGLAGLTLALQLTQARPGTAVLVVERQAHPVPETIHKVGESTVEIAAHYLRDTLGLADHLSAEQIRKFGLRVFFSNDENTDISRRVEVGSSVFPPLCTYQLDRGRLENELGRRCVAAGIEFVTEAKVSQVSFTPQGQHHHLRVQTKKGVRDVSARWVVDASGRAKMVQRQLDLGKKVEHSANAVWFRVAHPVDLTDWTDDPQWHERVTEGDRALSTNHLMGPGYWVWLIRLASGSTSIGIVTDADQHDFADFNTMDRALAWLSQHEPQCAGAVQEQLDKVQDFRVMKDYAYGCEQVFSGADRWCLTGEAGLFLDPLYSPGLDLIAISNGLVTDLVTRFLDGEDIVARAAIHDSLFRNVTDIWMAIYEKQYRLLGNATVMSSKIIWDTAFYWGVFGVLFFNDKFCTLTESPSVATDLGRLTSVSNRIQAFFREWHDIDDSDLQPQFVDLYSPLNFMVSLHAGMSDELSKRDFDERFSANTRLFEQLAGQLVAKVINAHAARMDNDLVLAQIQRWQRDPLISELLTAYRRGRFTNPTSEGWINLESTAPPISAALSTTPERELREHFIDAVSA